MTDFASDSRRFLDPPEEHACRSCRDCRSGMPKTGSTRIGRLGQKIRSLRRTISESDSHLFNMLVTDIHPYVQDQMFAESEGIFGKRLVAGAFVFSAGLGLVATNCVNAFSYGYDKLRFIKPVFLNDTIYTIRTNMDKRPRYKELGLIRASYEVFKNEGELVLYCEHLQTVKYKNPADFIGKTEK